MTNLKIAEAAQLSGIESQKVERAEATPIDERLQKRLDRALYAGGRPGDNGSGICDGRHDFRCFKPDWLNQS